MSWIRELGKKFEGGDCSACHEHYRWSNAARLDGIPVCVQCKYVIQSVRKKASRLDELARIATMNADGVTEELDSFLSIVSDIAEADGPKDLDNRIRSVWVSLTKAVEKLQKPLRDALQLCHSATLLHNFSSLGRPEVIVQTLRHIDGYYPS